MLYSLILVWTKGWQAYEDFVRIKEYVEAIAPDIQTLIVDNEYPDYASVEAVSRNPSFIFSPLTLAAFRPLRGKVYMGRIMSKVTEISRLHQAGIPVPLCQVLTPECVLDPKQFGDFVIVKPTHPLSSHGIGVELWRTSEVRYNPPEAYPQGHPGRDAPMLVQRFIDCGRAMTCRILTLFGQPIFSYCRESTLQLKLLGKSGPFTGADFLPQPANSVAKVCKDPDILALAARTYQAMPEIALQACDILRGKDGQLYLLEVNPGGGTWMFSNGSEAGYRERLGLSDLQEPFDAFRTCAALLIERTRSEAI